MNRQNAHREDIAQLAAFLKEGRHLTPEGEVMTLNAFRIHFLQNSTVRTGFPTIRVLKDFFPAHEKALRAASLKKVAAAGYIVL